MVYRRRRALLVWLLVLMPILWFLFVTFVWDAKKGFVKGEEKEKVKEDVNLAPKEHAVSIVKDEEDIDESWLVSNFSMSLQFLKNSKFETTFDDHITRKIDQFRQRVPFVNINLNTGLKYGK